MKTLFLASMFLLGFPAPFVHPEQTRGTAEVIDDPVIIAHDKTTDGGKKKDDEEKEEDLACQLRVHFIS